MCGIVGVRSFEGGAFTVTPTYLARMRDAMVHRGPDGAGLWVSDDRKVGLGHRRLSIIDLSDTAGQPMSNEDGTLWVTFNGEIYNHAEIREELEALGGHQWRTDHSDTEVILHAFEQWGIDCVNRFRGMFAFALWDAKTEEVWLVRDRIGVKPLYYSIHHGRLTFASEIKALLEDPDQHRAVNEEGVFHYLSFLTTPSPMTLFDGINKLEPGTWMRVDRRGQITSKKYWDVWEHTESLESASEDEVCERVLETLREAVSLRGISDVPVGVFLSGGIDSSTNAALFSEGSSTSVKTFTVGYQGEYDSCRNELHYARMMADEVGAKHHEILLGVDDLLDFLPQMIRLQDEPIGDPVCVPVYYVSKLARDNGVTVCQVGEGADELFWGYPTWKLKLRLQQAAQFAPVPRWAKQAGLYGLNLMGKGDSHQYEALRRDVAGQPVFWGGVDAFPEAMKMKLLSPRMRAKFCDRTSWDALSPMYDRFQANAWEQSNLNWMSYVDLSLRLPELLLMRVDKMSMGVSLEGRVPFLDHKFVELAMSIPERMKTKNGTLKHVLKKAVRGVIPDELIDRKKQGFGVPVYEWLFDKLGPVIEAELADFCDKSDILDPAAVRTYIRESRGPGSWYLLNLALWWKEYIAGESSLEKLAA